MMGSCLEKTEATDFEANSEETKSESKHQEITEEETAVENVGALNDRYRDRHLAVGCRRQSKKRTQGNGGSQQKLVAARRRLTRRAIPEPCKGYGRQGPGKESVAREYLKNGRSKGGDGRVWNVTVE
jgi:hypothetical protein